MAEGSVETAQDAVLVVDLDGTLINTDMLLESWWDVLSRDVTVGIRALQALALRGRAAFKAVLAAHAQVDVTRIPYNAEVVDLVRAHRAAGGRTVLATASHRELAQQVADHLDCFDEVHGSDETRNLKGSAKAALLVERYGERGFAYAGDSEADLDVWPHASEAITVGAGDRMRAAAEATAPVARHVGTGLPTGPAWLKALRPHQWVKNVLVFLPAIAAHSVDAGVWVASAIAFVTFSMVASGVYLLNDLLDLSADRAHPRKRRRPMASGALPLIRGSLMAPALLLGGLLLAFLLAPPAFGLTLICYFVLTTAYSFVLKRKLVIDICTLAGLYTIRILAGGVAAGLVISPWLLAFSIFLFLGLAAIKRQAELISDMAEGRTGASGRAYVTSDLPVVAGMALSSGYVAVLVLALYINSEATTGLYSHPFWLWGICGVVLFWISRAVMFAHRGWMDDDPVVFALKDRVSRVCGILAGIFVLLAAAG